MKILVTSSSKHGSTQEIAEVIGKRLCRLGHDVAVHDAKSAPPARGFDAAIIGSAVYVGSWQQGTRDYVDANQEALARMPVWLFSSGPLGEENPQPQSEPTQVPELMTKTGAREHKVFVGRLARESLSFSEKLIVKMVKAPYGDFRDWEAIRAWAGEIASALEASAVPA